MATYTKNLGLKKPTQSDFYNVADWNENMEKIDAALGQISPKMTVHTITLSADKWSNFGRQEVACDGVNENEFTQLIVPQPIPSRAQQFHAAGVDIIEQHENLLIFGVDTMPAVDIVVRIVIFNS